MVKYNNMKHKYLKTYHYIDNLLYGVWSKMKGRCLNPNNPDYHNYGGRGIQISKRWVSSYFEFEKDMKPFYKKGLTLDRINNNGNYCKKNCRWITRKAQSNNTRRNRRFDGKTFTEWSNIINIKRSTLAQRFYVYKWPIDKVLSK